MNPKRSLAPRPLDLILAAAVLLVLSIVGIIIGSEYLTDRKIKVSQPSESATIQMSPTSHDPSSLEPLPEPVRHLVSEFSALGVSQHGLKGIEALPQNEQQSLWLAFSQARLGIRPVTEDQRTVAENKDVLYAAKNPGQQLHARFLDNGLRLVSFASKNGWSGVIGMDSVSASPQVIQQGTVLQYQHTDEGVTEWFDNQPRGIEHGFIVREDSSRIDGGNLRIPVRLENLRAVAMDQGGDLQLVNSEGVEIISYEKLQVWDADGVALIAHMVPTTTGLEIFADIRGARFPVVIDPLIISQEAKVGPKAPTSADGAANDYFGYAVSISGNTALIGAYLDYENNASSGSAYVFVRSGSTWTFQQQLLPTSQINNIRFGHSVSVSGNTALIGAYGDNYSNRGSAYVFVRSGSTWTLEQKISNPQPATDDYFGFSVCVENNTALISALQDDDGGSERGSVYVFVRNGTTWAQQQKLVAADSYKLGFSVSLSGDTALLGAPDTAVMSYSSDGAVYVFQRSGTAWTQQQKLFRPDGVMSDNFGKAVSVLGNTALIGAPGDDDKGDSSGSAYVYLRSGDIWGMHRKLVAYDGAARSYFGSAVALESEVAVVGSPGDANVGFSSGSVYPFWRMGDVWSQQRKLMASDAAEYDYFGTSVSLSGDIVLVGAYGDDGVNHLGNLANLRGAAYVFRVSIPDTSVDSDGDGLPDAFETGTGVNFSHDDTGSDPNNPDSDGDGISDGDEVNLYGTDPNDVDSDDDGFHDMAELDAGSDPANGAVTPDPAVFTLVDGFSLSVVSRLGSTYSVVGFTNLQSGSGVVFHDNIPGTGTRIYPFVNRDLGEDKEFWQFIETNP